MPYGVTIQVFELIPVHDNIALNEDEKVIAASINKYIERVSYPQPTQGGMSWDERLFAASNVDLSDLVDSAVIALLFHKMKIGYLGMLDRDTALDNHDMDGKLGDSVLLLLQSWRAYPKCNKEVMRNWIAQDAERIKIKIEAAENWKEAAERKIGELKATLTARYWKAKHDEYKGSVFASGEERATLRVESRFEIVKRVLGKEGCDWRTVELGKKTITAEKLNELCHEEDNKIFPVMDTVSFRRNVWSKFRAMRNRQGTLETT